VPSPPAAERDRSESDLPHTTWTSQTTTSDPGGGLIDYVPTGWDPQSNWTKPRGPVTAKAADDVLDVAATRVKLRAGTKAEIRANAPKTASGDFIDPNTGQVIPKGGPFHYGHKPGYEWSRTQQMAREQGWTRERLIAYENDPSHFQIEDPLANLSHRFEKPR